MKSWLSKKNNIWSIKNHVWILFDLLRRSCQIYRTFSHMKKCCTIGSDHWPNLLRVCWDIWEDSDLILWVSLHKSGMIIADPVLNFWLGIMSPLSLVTFNESEFTLKYFSHEALSFKPTQPKFSTKIPIARIILET